MAIRLSDASAVVQGSQTSYPLTVGIAAPGCLRIVRICVSASRTFSSVSAGWGTLADQLISGSRRIGIFTRTLRPGDTDGTVTFDASTGVARTAVSVGGHDVGQALAASHGGSSTASSSLVAPSVSTEIGTLLTWHDVTLTSGADTSTMSDPSSPWARLAYSVSDSTAGFNALIGSEPRPNGGVSGTRTATSSGSGTWAASSLFVRAAPPAQLVLPPARRVRSSCF